MFPEADVPVVQLSMPTLDPHRLFALGERLAPLRDENVLILGSGFTTHNLGWFNPSAPSDAAPPTPSAEFDHWAAETVGRGDVDSVLDFLAKAPAAREAHPRTEHWAPLYVALGAAAASGGVDARERHRRLLVRPEQALLAVRLTPDADDGAGATSRTCTRLPSVDDYLACLDAAVDRMAVWSRAAGPDAPVPTCPGWTVRDLLAHQGMVHRWATAVVRGDDPARVDDAAVEAEGRAAADPVGWLLDGARPSSTRCVRPPTTSPS